MKSYSFIKRSPNIKGVKPVKRSTKNLIKAYKDNLISGADIHNIFKDKPVKEFLQFLNDLGDLFLLKRNDLMENCRCLLFGKDKADEVEQFFLRLGLKDTAKKCQKIVAKQNKYFFPA